LPKQLLATIDLDGLQQISESFFRWQTTGKLFRFIVQSTIEK
jgi:hypothetical protein